jgi:hypothetical protein
MRTSKTKLSPSLLRAALAESIRMGPGALRSESVRLAKRARGATGRERAAALGQATRAIAAAEALAREYEAGRRTQTEVVTELRRKFPWLGKGDLAERLGSFGYYLVIM